MDKIVCCACGVELSDDDAVELGPIVLCADCAREVALALRARQAEILGPEGAAEKSEEEDVAEQEPAEVTEATAPRRGFTKTTDGTPQTGLTKFG